MSLILGSIERKKTLLKIGESCKRQGARWLISKHSLTELLSDLGAILEDLSIEIAYLVGRQMRFKYNFLFHLNKRLKRLFFKVALSPSLFRT